MNIFLILVGLWYFVACDAAPVITTVSGTCSFDTGLCGYTQDANDRFDWTRNTGSTPSWGTGPSGSKGFYMYIETSWPRLSKENAVLVSPVLDKSMNCLEFFYHMKGVNIMTLNVYTQEASGSRTLRWSLTGQQDSKWLHASIHFQNQDLYKVAFEGVSGTGWMADIAIDNITVSYDQKCQIFPKQAAPVTPTQTPDANLPSGVCGHRQETRIVGGTAAQPGEWPWQVMLMYKRSDNGEWSQFCGGTLVTPDWVVTASHCVSDIDPSTYADYRIRAGAHQRNQTNMGSDIERIYIHEDYNAYPYQYDNDIALIKLKNPVMLDVKNIFPACISNDTATFPPGTKCYITGWGTLSSGGDAPLELQEAQVPLVSRADCTKNGSYPAQEISSTMLCAGYVGVGGVDSCQGDSGGPLVCKNNGLWYLVGVTSWGYSCADPKYPGVYANVPVLHQWLANTIARHVNV
ncbi:chymotrypsin-like elastase family member 2A [Exaiptasia diaphana]|uniref:Uncharacterized protein n=1 Tax=Exaiptasia diaphana TaxID=2652724 RepID=A0A913Y8D5_EXADI|nr:chymotrypsin-like elastase family member 2A [Exaiptasia diaphana]